jgi:hypothetical protein
MLDLCAMYSPDFIGPNIKEAMEEVEANNWRGYVCVCSTILKDEGSSRCHMTSYHRIVGDYLLLF